MPTFCLLLLISVLGSGAVAQDLSKFNLYHPEAEAVKGLAAAVSEAKADNKLVFIQAGGNWCIWCMRFNEFVTKDPALDSLMKANYVIYHLNYSKENENKETFAKYGFAQRFGFPVFMILDKDGKLIHTQNSGYLEKDKSYDRDKVMGFFGDWSVKALNPQTYQE